MIELYRYFVDGGKPFKIKIDTVSGSLGDSRYIFKGKYAAIMAHLCSKYPVNIGTFSFDKRMFFLSYDELCNISTTIIKNYNIEFEFVDYD